MAKVCAKRSLQRAAEPRANDGEGLDKHLDQWVTDELRASVAGSG